MPRLVVSVVSEPGMFRCTHIVLINGGQPISQMAVFGSSSVSSLPLIGWREGLVCESVGKAELLPAHFHGKQSRVLSICHPSPSLTTFAFRCRDVRLLLLDLDSYGGTDPLGMFPLFF